MGSVGYAEVPDQGHHLIEVDVAGGQAEIAADPGRGERAADLQGALDPDAADVVVDNLEILGGDVELHRLEPAAADAEIAAERQRVESIVEQRDRVDVDAIRLDVDLPRRCSCT